MNIIRLGAVLAILAQGPAFSQTWVSPLLGDLGAHDPVLIQQGNTYHIFYTGRGLSSKTSPDRLNWKNTGAVLSAMPAWHASAVPGNTGDLWAPDIHFRDGKYWLYYSVSTFGSNVSAIGLLTSPTLDRQAAGFAWKDEGSVILSTRTNNYNAIDPNVIVDENGSPWLAFGSFWTGIKLVKLDPATGKPAAGAEITAIAARTSTALGIEAPFIVKRGAYYYLWVSWDVCCQGVNSTYNIRVGRAAQVNGPYLDRAGKKMTEGGGTLIDAGDARWKGPGHNAIFVQGDSSFLVNHAYDANRNGASTLQIRPLYYDAEGWPTLEKSQAVGVIFSKPARNRRVSSFPWPQRRDGLGRLNRDGLPMRGAQ